MSARGLLSLHTPPLLGRKPSSAKSRISISSKLIQTKRLQAPYFGHLRKTGGKGSYRLVHTPPDLHRNSPPLSPIIPALARPSRKSNHSRTYAIPVGGGSGPTNEKSGQQLSAISNQEERRSTHANGHQSRVTKDQSPVLGYAPLLTCRWSLASGRYPFLTGRWAPVAGRLSSPLSVSTRQYPAPIAPDLGKTEPSGIPPICGKPALRVCPLCRQVP
jgi:hypothetical protein